MRPGSGPVRLLEKAGTDNENMDAKAVIQGVVVKDIKRHSDERGWLIELFRSDEVDKDVLPAMSYVSLTEPGVARGPHEHREQTDYFCFVGPSTFKVYLWENRGKNRGENRGGNNKDTPKGSPETPEKMVIEAGEDSPRLVIVPPGVVHAYKNIGPIPGFVFNAPNRLFMGPGRTEEIDEIRYEGSGDLRFSLD